IRLGVRRLEINLSTERNDFTITWFSKDWQHHRQDSSCYGILLSYNSVDTQSPKSQTWTLFKETASRFKHPFGTIIASTYYCYTEPQTNQSMYQLKGTEPITNITNELPTLR
ncbi:MAG: hypothetical protein ACKPKO_59350, partial [Candidatus Fonsibacter sp.]